MIYTLGIEPLFNESEVSVDFILSYFKERENVQYDSETTGFDPYIHELICFQLGDYENQFVIHPSYISKFKTFLEEKRLIGHNIKFDLKFLYRKGIYPNRVWDTFLAESVIFCGIDRRKSLAAIAKERLGIDIDKSVRENIWEKGLTREVIEYSANDVKYLEQIKESQEVDLEEKDLLRALRIENSFVLCLAYIEYCGFKLDIDKWKKKCDKDYQEFLAAKEDLDNYIREANITLFIDNQLTLFSDEVSLGVKIKWSSPKQVAVLFKYLGIPLTVEKDGEIKESVEEKNIAKYSKQYPIIDKYLRYKGLEKLVGTYGENFFRHINPVTGRLHTQFKQLMDTGRLSSGGKNKQTKEEYINFQNIPSDKETRSCFVAEKGNTLLISDYSGQEQVVLANMSLDPNLLAFYDNGFGDMHSFVASKMYKELEGLTLEEIKEKHKDKRQAAKTAGFAINYGGNGFTIARNNNVSEEEGDFIYNSYFEAFGGLRDYFKKVQGQALKDGYVLINSHTRRKTFIAGYEGFVEKKESFSKEFWEEYRSAKEANSNEFAALKEKVSKWFRFKGAIERMALNYPIQGTSAEITKISGIYFFDWLKKENLLGTVLFCNTIHDENVVECPIEMVDKVSASLEHCMNKAADIYCKRVRLTATPEKSLFWKK